MKAQHISFIKIAFTTAMLLFLLQIGGLMFSTKTQGYSDRDNSEVYKSAYSANMGSIGAALSTRVGIAMNDSTTSSFGGYYSDPEKVGEGSQEKRSLRKILLQENMPRINAYLNLSRTDFQEMMDKSSDRRKTIEQYIDSLSESRDNALASISALESQKSRLLSHLSSIESQIEKVKNSMEEHFEENSINSTLEDTESYFVLRRDYTETFTDIVFINQFLRQYNFLINYNSDLLDTIITNKEPIINESYIVIPDSGDRYLRPLDLIFDANEV